MMAVCFVYIYCMKYLILIKRYLLFKIKLLIRIHSFFFFFVTFLIFNFNYVGVRVTFGLAKNTSSLSSSFSCVHETLLSVTLMLLSGFL